MGDRIPPGSYFQYPPPGVPSSPIRSSSLPSDRGRFVQHSEPYVLRSEPYVLRAIPLGFVIFIVFFSVKFYRYINKMMFNGFIYLLAL